MIWASFCVSVICLVSLFHHPEAPGPEAPEIGSTWRALICFVGVVALVLFIAGTYFSFTGKFKNKAGQTITLPTDGEYAANKA